MRHSRQAAFLSTAIKLGKSTTFGSVAVSTTTGSRSAGGEGETDNKHIIPRMLHESPARQHMISSLFLLTKYCSPITSSAYINQRIPVRESPV